MTAAGEFPDDSLALDFLKRAEALCTSFEEAWRSHRRPDVAEYLGDLLGMERDWLLRELIVLELDCRTRPDDAARYVPGNTRG